MAIKFLSFLFLFISISSFSQSEKTNDYLTQEENEAWLSNFEKLDDKNAQLESVREKIIFDAKFNYSFITGICVGVGKPSRIETRVKNTKPLINKNTADCKILFVLQAETTYPIDLQKNPEYLPLVKMLNAENITLVNSFKGVTASALYGSRASCGVVIMTSEDDKVAEALKQLNQKTTKS